MLRGEIYKRAMSAETTEHFIQWIRRDYGNAAFRNAISALRKHIPYNGGAMRGHLRILEKLEHMPALPGDRGGSTQPRDAITISWKDNRFVDVLPIRYFAAIKSGTVVTHKVIGPRKEISKARCRLTVRQADAELDYEPFRDFNLARGMLLGVMRLRFADADRTSVLSVEWRDAGSANFTSEDFKPTGAELGRNENYVGPGKQSQRLIISVRERKGQAKFRRKLKLLYDNRCSISGCGIPQALEGAHIDPFVGPDSDNPQNGILLRRDIHALFDAHLVGINPTTRVVYLAKEARSWPEFASIHGVQKLRPPITPDPSYLPSTDALERHWQIFKRMHPLDGT